MNKVSEPELRRAHFRTRGFKATPQRLVIVDMVQKSMEHLSSDEIFTRVQKRLPGVSRATVYNTLHTLTECGMVRELDLNSGSMLYDGNPAPHHHLVCEQSGKIFDIPAEQVPSVDLSRLRKEYEITSYTIVFRGKLKTSSNKKGA